MQRFCIRRGLAKRKNKADIVQPGKANTLSAVWCEHTVWCSATKTKISPSCLRTTFVRDRRRTQYRGDHQRGLCGFLNNFKFQSHIYCTTPVDKMYVRSVCHGICSSVDTACMPMTHSKSSKKTSYLMNAICRTPFKKTEVHSRTREKLLQCIN